MWYGNNVVKKYYGVSMDNRSVMICLLVVVVVLIVVYFVSRTTRDNYRFGPYQMEALPTPPNVEYIQGHPDMHVVDSHGNEIIPHGDITLSPGFGVGQGLVGFGRYGSSMMA